MCQFSHLTATSTSLVVFILMLLAFARAGNPGTTNNDEAYWEAANYLEKRGVVVEPATDPEGVRLEEALEIDGLRWGAAVRIRPHDRITDDDLAVLPNLNPIFRLSLYHPAITQEGFKELKGIEGLRWVNIRNDSAYGNNIPGGDVRYPISGETLDGIISYLADNPHLESIGFTGPLHGETLSLFSNHDNLTTLKLRDAFLTEEGLRQLGTLTELETLTLVDCYVNDTGAKHLGNLRNLKSVNLSKNPLTGRTLGSLKEASHLHSLRLINCNLSAEGIAALSELNSLDNLFLGDNQIGDRALKRLAAGELKGLSDLSLIRTDVTDKGMEYLASFSGLRGVGLAQTYVTGRGMRYLGGMESLVWVGLRQTNLTDENVRGLRHLTQIKSLALGGTAITDAAIPVLATLEQLQNLNVSRTGITQEGIRALGEALPECEIEGSHFYPPGAMKRFLEAPL